MAAAQTPPDLATSNQPDPSTQSRMSFYMRQLSGYLSRLPDRIRYGVTDGYYAKSRGFDTTTEAGCHLITKLRRDANLRYLYDGPQTSRGGAPKLYDGKVDFEDLSRFQQVGRLEDNSQVEVYSQKLNSPNFARNFRVVVGVDTKTNSYLVLACTDLALEAMDIVKCYRLRFQIELIFREAKQHAGLTHCQTRSPRKLAFHLNMSLAAVNLARARIWRSAEQISMNSFVRRAYNRWLADRFLLKLGLKAQFDLNHPNVQQVIRMGSMTG